MLACFGRTNPTSLCTPCSTLCLHLSPQFLHSITHFSPWRTRKRGAMQALIGSCLMAATEHVQRQALAGGWVWHLRSKTEEAMRSMYAQPGVSEECSLTMRYWRSALLASRSCALCRRALGSAHRSLRACTFGMLQ